jgi:hypothetical protein
MLLPRKSDPWAGLEAKVWHSVMREERGTPSLRIVTDEGIRILPYAYFQEASCQRHGETWEIALHWPSVIVTVRGRNMEKMPELIAEHGLALLEFHPQGDRREDLPEFESILLTTRPEDSSSPQAATAKPPRSPAVAHRQCYSVV